MASKINKGLKRTALSVALGMCFVGGVQAQSTTGGIVGSAPAGSTITISNNSGLTRTITADADGRYVAGNLPVGAYTVTAGGSKRDVTVTLGGNAFVSFGGDSATTIETVTVNALGASSIDVSSVTTSTILTAAEINRMPIGRSAEAIALLSPGAVPGNGAFFGGQIAFGGSSVAENAYYLNGYFSGNPITNVGGFTLPFGSIEQQQTYTGGYGAKYGRSAGGVISQVGKSGNNEWHFGGQIVFTPDSLKSERPDRVFPSISLPAGYSYSDPTLVGVVYDRGKDRLTESTSYSGYISGPIIEDRLFFFLSAEESEDSTITPGGNPDAGFSATGTKNDANTSRVYAKLNWNITDDHLLEYTYLSERYERNGTQYAFDYDTYAFGAALNPTTDLKDNTEFSILRYTGYLTDNLTLTANYGQSRNLYDEDPILTGNPLVGASASQNPALNGGTPRTNTQAAYQAVNNAVQYTDGLRIELEWVWGDHTFNFGMDNTTLSSYFDPNVHDTGNKTFSSFYNNTVIAGKSGTTAGNLELDALLNMIFAHPEVARYLVRKLYRFFVYYEIDAGIETNVIVPLADLFRANNYEVQPVLQALFTSQHFFDMAESQGCIIKNPLDFCVGTARTFGLTGMPADIPGLYRNYRFFRDSAGQQTMNPGNPPNVAGWGAYHQAPDYHELWINADTLRKRKEFADRILISGSNGMKADILTFTASLTNAANPNTLISEVLELLHTLPSEPATIAGLKSILLSNQSTDAHCHRQDHTADQVLLKAFPNGG